MLWYETRRKDMTNKMKKCDYCNEVKVVNLTDEEHDLCLNCLEGLQINWLEVIEIDAHTLEISGVVDNTIKKRII
jgi:hypothetical protein